MAKTMRPIDLVRKANENEKIETAFSLEISGEKIDFLLTAPDIFEVVREQEVVYQIEFARCFEKGLHARPVNESDWQAELSKIENHETRKSLTADKPRNLAEQIAKKISRFDTIRVLLPKKLKTADGQLAFPTEAEQAEFGAYISAHPAAMNILTREYISLMDKLNEVNKSAKNSPPESGAETSDSK